MSEKHKICLLAYFHPLKPFIHAVYIIVGKQKTLTWLLTFLLLKRGVLKAFDLIFSLLFKKVGSRQVGNKVNSFTLNFSSC